MAKQGPALIDPRLAKAHEHPIRIEILRLLQEEPSGPARLSRRMENVSLNLVSHHIKVLHEAGCIELVETVEKRGATEHIYRATEPRFISAAEWREMSPRMRQPITSTILRLISADTARSLAAGMFDEEPERHLSRSSLRLDMEGWMEVVETLRRTLDEIFEVKEKSAKRLAESGEDPLAARVAIMQFTVPGDDESEDKSSEE